METRERFIPVVEQMPGIGRPVEVLSIGSSKVMFATLMGVDGSHIFIDRESFTIGNVGAWRYTARESSEVSEISGDDKTL